MGDNVADAVTNDFGRIHDTTNCYVAGPALFPTMGSPNPMLTGVALSRRSAGLLADAVLPKADVVPPLEAGFRALFDGTAKTFKNWQLAGPPGGGMSHINGEMVSYGGNGLRLFFYATELFGDFTLRLQFRIFDAANHNSGVFLRFPRPSLDLSATLLADPSRLLREPSFDVKNPAWKPVISGFEVQIDDNARGDINKDFWGIKPEPDGKYKNRTGAFYKIPAGDRVWHLGFNEPATQTYTPGPPLQPGVWFEYEIVVQGNDYTVFLTNMATRPHQDGVATPRLPSRRVDRNSQKGSVSVGINPQGCYFEKNSDSRSR